jgi:hypothetical protein
VTDYTVNEFNRGGGFDVLRTWTLPGKEVQVHTWTGDKCVDVKVFTRGSRVRVHAFWVSSDGPVSGYTEYLWGTVRSVGAKSVMIDADDGAGRRMKIEDFSHMNCLHKPWMCTGDARAEW